MTFTTTSLFHASTLAPARALELRQHVETFHADYCATLDSGSLEDWPEFFTEQGIYRVTARENAELGLPVGLVYCEGKGMLQDRAVAINRTQMFAPRYMLHLVTNTRVTAEEADGAIVAQANFLLMQTLVEGPTTVHMAGTYHDVFVVEGDRLLLKDRQVIYDSTIIANDLVYPV